MTTVVTGAAGHVGGNLVRELLARGQAVRAVVRDDRRALEGLDLDFVEANVEDLESLRAAFDGADLVHHLAARISIVGDPDGAVRRTNVDGVAHVIQACRDAGVRRLVHYSSIHAFDPDPADRPIDEDRPLVTHAAPAYDRSKAAGQRLALEAAADGMDVVVVHPTAVLGPHDYKPSRMGEVLLDVATGRMPSLIHGGFDWVDVRDVVAGGLTAAKRGKPGRPYLLSGHWHSLGELAAIVQQHTGQAPPALTSPMWLARIGAPFVQTWARVFGQRPLYTSEALHALWAYKQVSSQRAEQELGYRKRSIEETVRDTLEWFAEAGWL
jgi:dihydroflavonol-4-reductase